MISQSMTNPYTLAHLLWTYHQLFVIFNLYLMFSSFFTFFKLCNLSMIDMIHSIALKLWRMLHLYDSDFTIVICQFRRYTDWHHNHKKIWLYSCSSCPPRRNEEHMETEVRKVEMSENVVDPTGLGLLGLAVVCFVVSTSRVGWRLAHPNGVL